VNRRELLGSGLLTLMGSALGVATAQTEEFISREIPRDRMLRVAREIMIAARYCALITSDETGRPQARTMDAFPPDDDMTVWFGTNPRSRKVKQIERDSRVTLYYFDPGAQGYVTMLGGARLVNDPREKKAHWKDGWTEFYPNRERDYLLIAVTPERFEVVSPKHGITGDSVTWLPPSIRLEPARPHR
jgi:general stress protein 26